MEIHCREARPEDVPAIGALIRHYAEQGIMLPRSEETLLDTIDTFVVAEADGRLVGCGSLCRLGEDLVEIRSLGVAEDFKGRGVGGKLVEKLEEEARKRGIAKLMALTYEVAFFEKKGYGIVPKDIFPEKVWRDCIHCKKRYSCDEIAVLKRLD